MDPQFITIKNFMSHQFTEIDCTKFESVLIMGQSKSDIRESNGIGKTAIFNAIEYALFGTYPTTVLDGIVRDGSDLCQVEFEFKLDDICYKIIRERKRGKTSDVSFFERLNDGTLKTISQKTPTETQNEIQNLLKINAKAFRNSVLFSQSDLDGIASAKSAEDRRIILKDALNLGDYPKLEKLVKDEVCEISKKILTVNAILESIGNPSEDIDDLRNKLQQTEQSISKVTNKKNITSVTLNSKKAELTDLQRCISVEMSVNEEKLLEVKNKKDQVSSKILEYKSSIQENNQKLLTFDLKLNKKRQELTKIQSSYEDLHNKKVRPIDKVKSLLLETAQNEVNGKAFLSTLESRAAELQKPIPDGDECQLCMQIVTDEYREACEKDKKTKARLIEDEIAVNRVRLKKISNKKNQLQKELNEINDIFAQQLSLENVISSKTSEIKNDDDYISRINKLNDQIKSDFSLQEKTLDELISREANLLEIIRDVSNDDINLKMIEVKNQISDLENELAVLVREESSAMTAIGGLIAKIDSKTDDLKKLQEKEKEAEELEEMHSLHKEVKKAFSSGGIPTMVIHTILDDLQFEANTLLAELKPGHELQFTPDLEILFRVNGKEREYKQLSGGQKMLMALSLKIGLSLVIQNRLGVNIKFLGFDEVDQPLDKSAVEHFAEIIRKLQKRFKIFVITHNDSLKEKFNNVILVEGDRINGATSKLVSF